MVSKRFGVVLAAIAGAALSCAHAPPATGNKDPNAPLDPDYPEINCQLNNTVDCRPAGNKR